MKNVAAQRLLRYGHDYEHLSEGKVIPHKIYDLQANKGFVSIGTNSETAD